MDESVSVFLEKVRKYFPKGIFDELCVDKEKLCIENEDLKVQLRERDDLIIDQEKKLFKMDMQLTLKEHEQRIVVEGLQRTRNEETVT